MLASGPTPAAEHMPCADGYLTLVGRKKELINRGGEKISPAEVEAAVSLVPGVATAVCFALPDKWYGEKVAVAVAMHGPELIATGEHTACLLNWLAAALCSMPGCRWERLMLTARCCHGALRRRRQAGGGASDPGGLPAGPVITHGEPWLARCS